MKPRHLLAALVLFSLPACSPPEPRERIHDALATLESDASGSRRSRACAELQRALAEHPFDAADRDALIERAVRGLVAALSDPLSRGDARRALVDIGPPAYEALFATVIAADTGSQEAALTCLLHMSGTAVPVLVPALLGDDMAAQDRAATILARMGSPVAETVRSSYMQIIEPFSGRNDPTDPAQSQMSMRGKAGISAFAAVLGKIGDRTCQITLLEGADALHHRYPDLASEHLRILESLGRETIDRLATPHQLTYERLKVVLHKDG